VHLLARHRNARNYTMGNFTTCAAANSAAVNKSRVLLAKGYKDIR
jgi:hypothetical protein